MNKYSHLSKVEKPVRMMGWKDLPCKSEACEGRTTKHDHNRVADDGRVMYTCRDCGEERSEK